MIEQVSAPEKAYIVAVVGPDDAPAHAAALLEELVSLSETLGMQTVGRSVVRYREVSPRYFLGSGKADEIAAGADAADADIIVFDQELTPSQQRNWEEKTGKTVTDRHGVILEIFLDRAHTREARLQVALARMEYMLPRLTSAWSHLSRQRGGRRGTRGEGETQLEVDRRIVQQRIASVKRDLKQVQSQRATMRRQRVSVPIPTGSIVGYTNAGKSSLLRALTGGDVLVANKLFATLDPATRRLELDGGQEVLLTDTVGFIRKLPHDLVDAFKSTLEETVLAGFLIHVVDASDPAALEHSKVTREVLEEIGTTGKPVVTVLNKMDRVTRERRPYLHLEFDGAIEISAATGQGLDTLREAIRTVVTGRYARVAVRLPHDRFDLAALIHRTGRVIQEEYDGSVITIEADVPERTRNLVAEYTSA